MIIGNCMAFATELNTQRGTDPYFPGNLTMRGWSKTLRSFLGKSISKLAQLRRVKKLLN
jgi:hypothetical protein